MLWQQLVERILALRPEWDPAELGAFRFLEGGYSNENYRFRYHDTEFVLRVPGRPGPYVDRARERALYTALGGLPMPEVVGFEPDTGVMISRWISGRLLADLDPTDAQLAGYLCDLHDRLGSAAARDAKLGDRRYDPLFQARASLAAAPGPAWIHALAEAFDWAPTVTTLCHNDLNPWNVIELPNRTWVTLDWEWAGANDPLFDLVTLHQGLGRDDATLPALAARLTGSAPDAERLHACLCAFWLREYSWANAEIASGSTRREIAAQRELGERRLRELGRPPQDSRDHATSG